MIERIDLVCLYNGILVNGYRFSRTKTNKPIVSVPIRYNGGQIDSLYYVSVYYEFDDDMCQFLEEYVI